MSEFEILRLVALLMAAGLVLPGFLYTMKRAKKGSMLRNVALWLLIAVIIALAYSYFGPAS